MVVRLADARQFVATGQVTAAIERQLACGRLDLGFKSLHPSSQAHDNRGPQRQGH